MKLFGIFIIWIACRLYELRWWIFWGVIIVAIGFFFLVIFSISEPMPEFMPDF